ncbi:MAG TPA: NAD(P)/FAD-dependent oxidoreductase [Thermoanaerobaculia bacterium]|nr:NAD(P)/FAD-dependent oxidoreductase [Thermoanaerobaculia bacterium]
MEERVLVVGAGLVGSLLALFLNRLGFRVQLVERHPDPRLPVQRSPEGRGGAAAGRSINLTICERGFAALDRVGAGDAVRAIAVPCHGRVIHNVDGSLEYQPYGCRGEAIHSVSRGQLNRTLLALALEQPGIDCAFDEKCLEVDLNRPAATFQNHRTGAMATRDGTRLFGADGAYSQVRLQMQKTQRFDYAQEYLDQAYKELRLPAAAAGGWALEKNAIHIWPRGHFMLIGFPNVDATFTVALHMPYEGQPSFSSINGAEELLALFHSCFPDAVPLMPTLVEDFFSHPATSMITVRCFPWTCGGRVALVGDAAHAIVPSYGQGANSGFEDCSVLADCLAAGESWPAALAEYERRRKPNAEAIADLALEHFAELRDRVGDPEFLLRKEVERRLSEIYPERFTPLYALVSFTNLPYVEALARGREQEKLISRVMAQPRLRERLGDELELRRLLEPLLREAALVA